MGWDLIGLHKLKFSKNNRKNNKKFKIKIKELNKTFFVLQKVMKMKKMKKFNLGILILTYLIKIRILPSLIIELLYFIYYFIPKKF